MEPGVPTFLKACGVVLIGLDVPSVDPVDSKILPVHQELGACGIHILEIARSRRCSSRRLRTHRAAAQTCRRGRRTRAGHSPTVKKVRRQNRLSLPLSPGWPEIAGLHGLLHPDKRFHLRKLLLADTAYLQQVFRSLKLAYLLAEGEDALCHRRTDIRKFL